MNTRLILKIIGFIFPLWIYLSFLNFVFQASLNNVHVKHYKITKTKKSSKNINTLVPARFIKRENVHLFNVT